MALYETCSDDGRKCALLTKKITCAACGKIKPCYNACKKQRGSDTDLQEKGIEEEFNKLFCRCAEESCYEWLVRLAGFGPARAQLGDEGEDLLKVISFEKSISGHSGSKQCERTSKTSLGEIKEDSQDDDETDPGHLGKPKKRSVAIKGGHQNTIDLDGKGENEDQSQTSRESRCRRKRSKKNSGLVNFRKSDVGSEEAIIQARLRRSFQESGVPISTATVFHKYRSRKNYIYTKQPESPRKRSPRTPLSGRSLSSAKSPQVKASFLNKQNSSCPRDPLYLPDSCGNARETFNSAPCAVKPPWPVSSPRLTICEQVCDPATPNQEKSPGQQPARRCVSNLETNREESNISQSMVRPFCASLRVKIDSPPHGSTRRRRQDQLPCDPIRSRSMPGRCLNFGTPAVTRKCSPTPQRHDAVRYPYVLTCTSPSTRATSRAGRYGVQTDQKRGRTPRSCPPACLPSARAGRDAKSRINLSCGKITSPDRARSARRRAASRAGPCCPSLPRVGRRSPLAGKYSSSGLRRGRKKCFTYDKRWCSPGEERHFEKIEKNSAKLASLLRQRTFDDLPPRSCPPMCARLSCDSSTAFLTGKYLGCGPGNYRSMALTRPSCCLNFTQSSNKPGPDFKQSRNGLDFTQSRNGQGFIQSKSSVNFTNSRKGLDFIQSSYKTGVDFLRNKIGLDFTQSSNKTVQEETAVCSRCNNVIEFSQRASGKVCKCEFVLAPHCIKRRGPRSTVAEYLSTIEPPKPRPRLKATVSHVAEQLEPPPVQVDVEAPPDVIVSSPEKDAKDAVASSKSSAKKKKSKATAPPQDNSESQQTSDQTGTPMAPKLAPSDINNSYGPDISPYAAPTSRYGEHIVYQSAARLSGLPSSNYISSLDMGYYRPSVSPYYRALPGSAPYTTLASSDNPIYLRAAHDFRRSIRNFYDDRRLFSTISPSRPNSESNINTWQLNSREKPASSYPPRRLLGQPHSQARRGQLAVSRTNTSSPVANKRPADVKVLARAPKLKPRVVTYTPRKSFVDGETPTEMIFAESWKPDTKLNKNASKVQLAQAKVAKTTPANKEDGSAVDQARPAPAADDTYREDAGDSTTLESNVLDNQGNMDKVEIGEGGEKETEAANKEVVSAPEPAETERETHTFGVLEGKESSVDNEVADFKVEEAAEEPLPIEATVVALSSTVRKIEPRRQVLSQAPTPGDTDTAPTPAEITHALSRVHSDPACPGSKTNVHEQPGEAETVQPGEAETVQPGEEETVQTGEAETVQPESVANSQPVPVFQSLMERFSETVQIFVRAKESEAPPAEARDQGDSQDVAKPLMPAKADGTQVPEIMEVKADKEVADPDASKIDQSSTGQGELVAVWGAENKSRNRAAPSCEATSECVSWSDIVNVPKQSPCAQPFFKTLNPTITAAPPPSCPSPSLGVSNADRLTDGSCNAASYAVEVEICRTTERLYVEKSVEKPALKEIGLEQIGLELSVEPASPGLEKTGTESTVKPTLECLQKIELESTAKPTLSGIENNGLKPSNKPNMFAPATNGLELSAKPTASCLEKIDCESLAKEVCEARSMALTDTSVDPEDLCTRPSNTSNVPCPLVSQACSELGQGEAHGSRTYCIEEHTKQHQQRSHDSGSLSGSSVDPVPGGKSPVAAGSIIDAIRSNSSLFQKVSDGCSGTMIMTAKSRFLSRVRNESLTNVTASSFNSQRHSHRAKVESLTSLASGSGMDDAGPFSGMICRGAQRQAVPQAPVRISSLTDVMKKFISANGTPV